MVADRDFVSRSQAIKDMLHRSLVEHRRAISDDVMVGIVTLVTKPKRAGFGSAVTQMIVAQTMNGVVDVDYATGFAWSLSFPVAQGVVADA